MLAQKRGKAARLFRILPCPTLRKRLGSDGLLNSFFFDCDLACRNCLYLALALFILRPVGDTFSHIHVCLNRCVRACMDVVGTIMYLLLSSRNTDGNCALVLPILRSSSFLYKNHIYTILYHTKMHCTIIILDRTILYYTILYYTILYYTILYYTILYYTILYYTIVHAVYRPRTHMKEALGGGDQAATIRFH